MEERITPHLMRKIKGGSVPITKQFVTDCIGCARFVLEDPLGEESKYSPVKGLIHKYPNRVLWKVTYRCAAHCRFCTRSRQIGSAEGDFDDRDIKVALQYLCNTPEVDDVILSGGDPLYAPKTVINVIAGLHTIDSVRVLRIDTRLPIHAPTVLKSSQVTEVLRTLKNSAERFAIYVLVHINHHELDSEAIEALQTLRAYGFIVLSQTVLLRGVNDDALIDVNLPAHDSTWTIRWLDSKVGFRARILIA